MSRGTRAKHVPTAVFVACIAAAAAADDFFIGDGDVPALIVAIHAANAGPGPHAIHLASSGTYVLSVVDNVTEGATALPVITNIITINGNGATIQRNTLPGTPLLRFFMIADDAELTLDGLTIRGGSGVDRGGAVYNAGALAVIHCTFASNSATTAGGAIYNNAANLAVTACTFSGNSANLGGAIENLGGTVTIADATFSGNFGFQSGGGVHSFAGGTLTMTGGLVIANTGGGISSPGAAATLTGVSVRQNTGGGVLTSTAGGSLTVLDCQISSNSSIDGGGVYNNGGTVLVVASTIDGNSAAFNGGGVYNSGVNPVVTVTNCTISGNASGSLGGGIYAASTSAAVTVTHATIAGNSASTGGGVYASSDAVTLAATIVADSAGGDTWGPYVDAGHNLVEDGSGVTNPTSLLGDPLLGPLADNAGPTMTHALLPGSKALDAADCAGGAVAADQRGVARPQGAACDIGAFELELACPADCNGDGAINILDFLCFQGLVGSGDPDADCNTDGVINILDFLCFQGLVTQGCG